MNKKTKTVQEFMEELFGQSFPKDITGEEALHFMDDIWITSENDDSCPVIDFMDCSS